MQSISDDIKQAVAKRMFGIDDWTKVLEMQRQDQLRFKDAVEWAEVGLGIAWLSQAARYESKARVIRNNEKILRACNDSNNATRQ